MSDQAPSPPHYVTKRWAADRWMISERTIDRLITAGVLRAYKIGNGTRAVRLDAAQVDRAMTARPVVK